MYLFSPPAPAAPRPSSPLGMAPAPTAGVAPAAATLALAIEGGASVRGEACDDLRTAWVMVSSAEDARERLRQGIVEYVADALGRAASRGGGGKSYALDARAAHAANATVEWCKAHLDGAEDLCFVADILRSPLVDALFTANARAQESMSPSTSTVAAGPATSTDLAAVMSADAATWKRRGTVALSAVLGGTALLLTGGLAAPAIAAGFASATASVGLGAAGSAAVAAASAGGGALAAGTAGGIGAAAAAHSTAERTMPPEDVHVIELNRAGAGDDGTAALPVVTELCFPGWLAPKEEEVPGVDEEGMHTTSARPCRPFADAGIPTNAWTAACVGSFEETDMDDVLSALKTVESSAATGAATAVGVRGLQMTAAAALATAAAPAMIAYSAITAHGGAHAVAMSKMRATGRMLAEAHWQAFHNRESDDVRVPAPGTFLRPVALVGVGVGALGAIAYAERITELASATEESDERTEASMLITSIHLVAAPIAHSRARAQVLAKSAASGVVVSAFSTHDLTTKVMPRCNITAEGLALSGVAGSSASGYAAEGDSQMAFWQDVDCSDIVGAHEDWQMNFPEVLSRLRAAERDAIFRTCESLYLEGVK